VNEQTTPHADHPAGTGIGFVVVGPSGAGTATGPAPATPGRYQFLSIGDGERAIFWVEG
jgi:hypothetical protein